MELLAEASARLGSGVFVQAQEEEISLDQIAPYLWSSMQDCAALIAKTEGDDRQGNVFSSLSASLRGWSPTEPVPPSAGWAPELDEFSSAIQETVLVPLPPLGKVMIIGGPLSTALKDYLAGGDGTLDGGIDWDSIGDLPDWASTLCDGLTFGFIEVNDLIETYPKKERHRIAHWVATSALITAHTARQRLM